MMQGHNEGIWRAQTEMYADRWIEVGESQIASIPERYCFKSWSGEALSHIELQTSVLHKRTGQ